MKNIMKQICENVIQVIVFAVLMFFFGFSPVYAQVMPFVDFTPDILFEKVNFLPGDIAEGIVDVENRTEESQDVITEAINISDSEGLSSALTLTIKQGSVVLYQDSFDEFLSAGEVLLSPISIGGGSTYTYTVVFGEEVSDYQGAVLGFDICVGFLGGHMNCGETEISDEGDTEKINDTEKVEDTDVQSSGGGGGGGMEHLRILNERITEKTINPGNDSTALVEWETTLWATGQVVYGPASGHYSLDMNDSRFGYPFASLEVSKKSLEHHILLTGLDENTLYKYRVVSRASPASVSHQHEFSLIPQEMGGDGGIGPIEEVPDDIFDYEEEEESNVFALGGVLVYENPYQSDLERNTEIIAANVSGGSGSDSGGKTEGVGSEENGEGVDGDKNSNQYNTAVVYDAVPDGFMDCIGIFIIALFLIHIFVVIVTSNYEDKNHTKHLLCWMFGVVIASVIMFVIDYVCVIWLLGGLLLVLVVAFSVYRNGME